MLSSAGMKMLSATVRDHNLYPPGVRRLKDVTSDYASLTASQKWAFASVMLLAFRPALVSVGHMVRFVCLGPAVIASV